MRRTFLSGIHSGCVSIVGTGTTSTFTTSASSAERRKRSEVKHNAAPEVALLMPITCLNWSAAQCPHLVKLQVTSGESSRPMVPFFFLLLTFLILFLSSFSSSFFLSQMKETMISRSMATAPPPEMIDPADAGHV